MIEKEKADPIGMSNTKSHPKGELDSVGVTTYEGSNKVQKLNQELECYINLFLNLNLINSDKIKEMTR